MKSGPIVTDLPAKSSSQRISSWGRRLVLLASGTLLFLAPLAYGAVHPWAYFGLGAAISVLSLGILSFGLYKIWASPQEKWLLPYPPVWWLGAGLVFILLFQVIPWPPGVLQRLSPGAWEIHSLGNGFGLAAYLPLSLNPYATWLEFLKLGPAVILFFMLILVINSRRQIRVLSGIILAVAGLEVLYGLSQFHSHQIWGWFNPYTGPRLCGTFINSNHLAIYLSMAILLGFGLFLEQREKALSLAKVCSRSAGSGHMRRLARPEHSEPWFRQVLTLFLLLLMTVGLIFTGSRGGMVSLIFGFILMGGLVWGKHHKRGRLLLIPVFLTVALLFSLLLGSAPQLGRFQDLSDPGRMAAMTGAVRIFTAYPWTGSGVGTFGELFYRYEPAALEGKYYIYAHNDWLQALGETGIPGFLLLAAAAAVFGATLVRQWRRRTDPFPRNLGLAGIAALGAAGFHALSEFPLHIPAVSLTLAGIAAITYLTVFSQCQEGADFFSYPAIRFPGPGKRAPWILSGLLVAQLVFLVQTCKYYTAEYIAPTEINSTRPQPQVSVDAFRRAARLNPLNSKYYLGLAEGLESQGRGEPESLQEAEKSLQTAILRAPGYWGCRWKLAELYLRRQRHDPGRYLPLGLKELAAAVNLFPESRALHFRLAAVISWAENHYYGLVPPELRGQSAVHAQMAGKIGPR